MRFAHDTEVSLQAAVTLINTAEPPDTLETVEALDEFYAEFEYSGRRDGDEAELAVVRALRPVLAVSLVGSIAGSSAYPFLGIWAIKELGAPQVTLAFSYLVGAALAGLTG